MGVEITMKFGKFNLFIARDFSVGFTVFSPKLNGVCFEIRVACFGFRFFSKQKGFIQFNNYWRG